MKFFSQSQYEQLLENSTPVAETIYRSPVLLTALFLYAFIFLGFLAVVYLIDPRVFGKQYDDLLPVAYGFLFIDVIIIKLVHSEFRARRKNTNWLVRQTGSGIILKFRSYRNSQVSG